MIITLKNPELSKKKESYSLFSSHSSFVHLLVSVIDFFVITAVHIF